VFAHILVVAVLAVMGGIVFCDGLLQLCYN